MGLGSISEMQQQNSPLNNVNPVLILGIVVFVLPYFSGIIHVKIPGWVGTIGIALILIGAVLSVIKFNH